MHHLATLRLCNTRHFYAETEYTIQTSWSYTAKIVADDDDDVQ